MCNQEKQTHGALPRKIQSLESLQSGHSQEQRSEDSPRMLVRLAANRASPAEKSSMFVRVCSRVVMVTKKKKTKRIVLVVDGVCNKLCIMQYGLLLLEKI